MKLDKTKLQEIVEKIAYQQTAEEQSDDLFNKMGILNEYVQEQLTLTDVVHLLTKYEKFASGENYINSKQLIDKQIKEFIEVNCA